jgi:hypothetical protein
MINPAIPFSKKASWRAYCQLFWCSPSDPRLVDAVKNLCEYLPDLEIIDSKETRPIYVLALGFGMGTLEIPFLAQLQKQSGRKVLIVAIDLHKEPLLFASHLLKNGLDISDLPESTNILVKELDEFAWDTSYFSNAWNVDNHLFIEDRLDYEYDESQVEALHFSEASIPSNWKERLKSKDFPFAHLVPDDGFDMVLSSFFLTHIDWWRSTLSNALSLLNKGGIFLYSRGTGDMQIIEGQMGERRSKNNQIGLIKDIFLHNQHGLYRESIINKYRGKVKSVNAIQPFALDNLLDYWCSSDRTLVRKIEELQYSIQNVVRKETYLAIIENRTFSAFRTIEKEIISKPEYEEIICDINKFVSERNECDNLIFDLHWSIYKFEQGGELASLPLTNRFMGCERSTR